MSQVALGSAAELPGIRPAELCEHLNDSDAARLLPDGAFKLITTLDPERISGAKRAESLGQILSLDLAVDDLDRRKILLNAVPRTKVGELEDRIGLGIDRLRQRGELDSQYAVLY